jgi:hypothetical protein
MFGITVAEGPVARERGVHVTHDVRERTKTKRASLCGRVLARRAVTAIGITS